jgi:hydroxyacylglutathione hydrolase
MKRVNRGGETRQDAATAKYLGFAELEEALGANAIVIDCRPAEKFAAGHVPGTVNIPLGKSFLNWTGALVPENRDFYLLTEADSNDAVKAMLHDLCKIGLTRVRGIFRSQALHDWRSRRGSLEQVAQLDATRLEKAGGNGQQVIDVRSPEEWSKGHLPGAIHIPLAALPDKLGDLDRARPIVLHCQGGGRSSIAASFLQAQGIKNVSNLAGGYEAWTKEGFPTES